MKKKMKYGGVAFGVAVVMASTLPFVLGAKDSTYVAPHISELSRPDIAWVNEQIAPICQAQSVPKAVILTAPGPKEAEVPTLLYHRVTDADPESHEVVSVEKFREHMLWLKAEGYNTISVKTLTDYMNKVDGVKLPPKPIVITFDDGWKDNIEAAKLLKELNFGATWYIISGFFESKMYMNVNDVQELAKNPKFEFGSHSHTHFIEFESKIDKLDLCTMARETFASKRILERVLKKPVTSIAWPYGHNTLEAVHVAETAGYTSTMLVNRDSKNVPGNSPLFTRRLNIDGSCPTDAFKAMVKTNELKECMS